MGKIISKLHLIWIIPIVLLLLYLKFFTLSSEFLPIENAFVSQANNFDANSIIDKYSANFSPFLYKILNLTKINFHYKILSLLISLIQLYFLYKFTLVLFHFKDVAYLSVFIAMLQAPIIFISQLATNDMLALTLFTLFLWHFSKLYKHHYFQNTILIILCSIEFFIVVLLNYVIIFLLPFAFIIIFRHSRKTSSIFLGIIIILLTGYYIFFENIIKLQMLQIIDNYNIVEIKFYKLFTRVGELIALPIMLFYAAYQFQWKSLYPKKFYFSFLSASLIFPIISIISYDIFSIYRLTIYSLIILIPIIAYLFKQFLTMNIHYKFSVIIVSIFMLLFLYWTLSKFHNSYPAMKNLTEFINNHISLTSNIYCEDKFFVDVNIKPIKKIDNIDRYYLTKDEIKIINRLIGGYYNVVILNGLIHKKLTENMREKFLKNYKKVYDEEFKINSIIYSQSQGNLEVYVLNQLIRCHINLLTLKTNH